MQVCSLIKSPVWYTGYVGQSLGTQIEQSALMFWPLSNIFIYWVKLISVSKAPNNSKRGYINTFSWWKKVERNMSWLFSLRAQTLSDQPCVCSQRLWEIQIVAAKECVKICFKIPQDYLEVHLASEWLTTNSFFPYVQTHLNSMQLLHPHNISYQLKITSGAKSNSPYIHTVSIFYQDSENQGVGESFHPRQLASIKVIQGSLDLKFLKWFWSPRTPQMPEAKPNIMVAQPPLFLKLSTWKLYMSWPGFNYLHILSL